MTSLQSKVDAAKTAVSSIATCSPATVVCLKSLLASEASSSSSTKNTSSRTAKSKVSGAKGHDGAELSTQERASLATFIINVALKALSDAAKPNKPLSPAKRTPEEKKALRRSNSMTALSPMKNRILNRVSTNPNVSDKVPKPTTSPQSTGCLATVECARLAFACLRSLKGPLKPGETDLQLEQGTLSLIGKLVALEMHDQALKELRILKRRLDPRSVEDESSAKGAMRDLLDFRSEISTNLLAVVTGYQLQVLRIISAVKKPTYVEGALPFLRESYTSAPAHLLLKLSKRSKGKEAEKVARQMATLSSVLLSLSPGVSTKDDAVASEPRLSPSPSTAFELQALALKAHLQWWMVAGHQGKVDEEVLAPLARCMRALLRRVKEQDNASYRYLATGVENILTVVESQPQQRPSVTSDSPMASIYQTLGSAAQSCRRYEDAHRWYFKLQQTIDTTKDSSVKASTVLACLLSVALKIDCSEKDTSTILNDVTSALDGSLSGTAQELNELLESLSSARKAIVGQLMKASDPTASPVSASFRRSLQQFLLRFPRFQRRWLGSKPAKDATTKQVLQYDQRRQMLQQSIGQVLDAVLMVIKTEIQARELEWQRIDEVLQDCAGLLHSVADDTVANTSKEHLDAYHVKISSLYYSNFNLLRRKSPRTKEIDKQALQSLSRSINAAKSCSPGLKTKAQISSKLEVFADLCKASGRTEEAVKTLRALCTNMVEDGILSEVTFSLEKQPPLLAWASSDNAALLSRTLRLVAKLDKSWNDWTFFLPEAQRAAVLEHLLYMINTSVSTSDEPLGSRSPGVAALLRIYSPDKFPVRRLRVLLHLAYQHIGNEEEVYMLNKLLEPTMEQVENAAWGEDRYLAPYAQHWKAYHDFVSAFSAGDDDTGPRMRRSLKAWDEVLQGCQDRSALIEKMDHPEELIDHLKSAAEFAHLRGYNELQLEILDLSVRISGICGSTGILVATNSALASRYVTAGLFKKALRTIQRTEELVKELSEVPQKLRADYLFCRVEYYSGIGNSTEALDALNEVTSLYNKPLPSQPQPKSEAVVTGSIVSLLQSIIQLQQGHVQEAFSAVKSSVRMLSHEWAKLETASLKSDSSVDKSTDNVEVGNAKVNLTGPVYWAMAHPLLKSLLHLSAVYAHIGMFQETIYYANTAWKVADSTQSSLYKAEVSVWTGTVYSKAFQIEEAMGHFAKVDPWLPTDPCSTRVHLLKQIGDFYLTQGEEERAQGYFEFAEEAAQQLAGAGEPPSYSQPDEVANKTSAAGLTATRGTRSKRAPASSTTKTPKRAAAKEAASPGMGPVAVSGDLHQTSLIAAVALSRVLAHIQQKDWSSALAGLEAVKAMPKLVQTLSQEQIVTATSLIGHSMEQMIRDPVFSVVPDSTISFPAVSVSSEHALEASAAVKSTQTKKTASQQKLMPAFAEALHQAQELLLNAHAESYSKSDSAVVHRIATLLQNTVMILSATTTTKSMAATYSTFAMVAADIARNITWKRELKTLDTSAQTLTAGMAKLSIGQDRRRRSSIAPISDLSRFRTSYIDSLPSNWNVVSLVLSDDQHDLCLTSYRSGHSPFILRLPLERASSRDADSVAFDFETAQQELLEIIKLANETSHSARDFTARGERNAWWAEREALDARLGDLLSTIETSWLGGFKGIFSRHSRRSDLSARFQKSFQQMLDGCLPSRKTAGRRKGGKANAITLDPRILDLFIGLGDPTDPDVDFDEALDDLLYFVVDVLQFHGERNAYDEIDFDAMVVETYDALRGYHSAAKSDQTEDTHTVLVLDKALHAFPWESLPCLQGQAVSRVPSLACLQQLVREAPGRGEDEGQATPSKGGHYVSAKSGTYILNPSADLKNTQTFFQPSFSTLRSWTGITKQEPSESDFEAALTNSEIFLYFGHGSGAQYIRGKTVRKLEKCKPATFLMGCSSVALSTAGEFECYGPVWNYMMAGCPAVVGALWDVTDRDIDRFAGKAFEEWGLLPRGSFKERQRSSKGVTDEDGEDGDTEMGDKKYSQTSLVEAVARARDVCKLRYLNAAAVVVYGIPVYIKKEA